MSSWLCGDRVYTELEIGCFATVAEARALVARYGATLQKERMSGSYYRADDGQTFRISPRGWASGYVVWKAVEDRKVIRKTDRSDVTHQD